MPDVFDSITSKGDIFDSIVPKEDIFDKIKGVGEAALSTGLSAVNWIPAGIIKASGVVSGQTEGGAELADFVQEKLSYQPKTETGKQLSGYVAAPFEYISEKSKQAADWTYEKTGNPYLATAVRTAGESIPFVAAPIAIKGVKGIKGKVVPPKIGEIIPKEQGKPYSITPEVSLKETVKPPEIKTEQPIAPVEKVEPTAKVEPLIEEAKKYKSAEEFVNSQLYYHGTNKSFNEFKNTTNAELGRGYYFTPDMFAAQKFAWGKKVNHGGKQNIITVTLTFKKPLVLGEGVDGKLALDLWEKSSARNTNGGAIEKIAKDGGYDAVIRKGYGEGDEIMVFDKKNIKIHSQAATPEEVLSKTADIKDNLTSIWNKAQEGKGTPKQEVKPEIPVEGELKPHGTALRIEAEGISKDLLDREGLGQDIAKYKEEKGMMDAQAKMGVEIMDKDYNSAVKMALGEIEPPQGVRPGTMITAVTKRALEQGDFDTIYKLGTTEKSYTVAQEIAKDLKSFDQGLTDNPVAAIQSIVKARKDEAVRTGQKVDPVKQNAEIEGLKVKLAEVQKKLDEYVASKKPKVSYGSQNKIVTNAEYLKVKEELRKQFSSQLNVGLDPTIAVKLGKIGTYHLEAGARTFAEWSVKVVEDVGAWVKPHLEELWKKSNEEMKSERSLKTYKTRLANEEAKLTEKIENLDFKKINKNKIKLDLEGKKLLDARDRIKIAYEAAIRKTGTVTREEAAQLVDLARTAAELKAKRDPNVKTNHGFSSAKERLEYGAAQVKFERYVAKLKEGDQSLSALAKRRVSEFKTTFKENPSKAVKDLAIDTFGELSDSSISLVASLDNSFIGRQGMLTLMTHPTVWAKAAQKSFSDIYKALRDKHGNEVAKDILHADLVSRENYINGTYQKSGILAKFEEQYPTSHPARVPYIGRAFKASEVAFTNTALRMRLGTFDLLLDMAKKQGLEIDKTLIKDIGDVVNSATARAKTHDSKLVKSILWAPKMIVANVNVLTGHGLGAGLKTSFARKQAAYNLMKATGETLAVVAVLDALKPNSVELDPRSSDFLKYRDGNTRIDLTAGRGQYITLVARFLTGQTKNAQTKIIKELNLDGLGKDTYFNIGMDFLKNKTSPMARQLVNVMEGRNFEGKKPTLKSTVADLTLPIPVQNFIEASPIGDYPDDRAITLVGNLADVFGINANTYQPLNQWDTKNTKEMKSLKNIVGEERFKQLNIKYNKTVNQKIENEVRKESYQRLSEEDKQKRIEKIRRDVKHQIIGR